MPSLSAEDKLKIQFLGAARTVTGSCFILEAQGHRWAVDCGLHQGGGEIEERNWEIDLYRPAEIEFVLVTHAHIDHSGLLPCLVKKGFRGPIFTTPPTRALLEIMLLDSAHIQEAEAQWRNKKNLRRGEKHVYPLYTQQDALATFPFFVEKPYNEHFAPFPGLQVLFKDAGHILGSALIELKWTVNGHPGKLVFSGDLGRPDQLLVEDASVIQECDFLFLESTYGDRDHKNEKESLDELAEAISYSYQRGEKVIIPAFAVERTQEIIYSLYILSKEGRLPADLPIYLDSPLAIRATQVFRDYQEYLDRPARQLIAKGEDPLSLPQLRYSETVQDSMAINYLSGPAIVISASGMAEAGRIRHHLRHNLWREGASIVFVGFQAQGTTGRKIVDGLKTIRLFHEDIAVKARIFTINGFSAHAGQSQILAWLSNLRKAPQQVFLVHGEFSAQQALAEQIKKRFGFQVYIPDYLEEIELLAPEEPVRLVSSPKASRPLNWEILLGQLEAKISSLRSKQKNLEKRAVAEQTELRERLQEVDQDLAKIIAEI